MISCGALMACSRGSEYSDFISILNQQDGPVAGGWRGGLTFHYAKDLRGSCWWFMCGLMARTETPWGEKRTRTAIVVICFASKCSEECANSRHLRASGRLFETSEGTQRLLKKIGHGLLLEQDEDNLNWSAANARSGATRLSLQRRSGTTHSHSLLDKIAR